jgi:hypothetical protein
MYNYENYAEVFQAVTDSIHQCRERSFDVSNLLQVLNDPMIPPPYTTLEHPAPLSAELGEQDPRIRLDTQQFVHTVHHFECQILAV